jgi:hypothetical protein
VKANPLVGDPAGVVAGRSALVGTNMPQPPETMQPARELYRRQFQFERRLLPGIENTAGEGVATVQDFFGDKGIDRPEVSRSDHYPVDPKSASLKDRRRQDSSRLPHLPPGFGNVKRDQSGAIFDSHAHSCRWILMIQHCGCPGTMSRSDGNPLHSIFWARIFMSYRHASDMRRDPRCLRRLANRFIQILVKF